jgi:hypothetical protein
MSSPDIKIQSLLRKYKNLSVENTEKQKVISNFSYGINNDSTLSTSCILKSLKEQNDVKEQNDLKEQNDVKEQNDLKEKSEITDYIGNSDSDIFANVYNSEFCDEEWVAFLYFISKNYINFNKSDKIQIKSLFLNSLSPLSACHHFLYNSSANLKNLEWKWGLATYYYKKHEIRKEYHNNILCLQDKQKHSANNINYIINEVISSHGKINFLIDTFYNDNKYDMYNNYIMCAILSIKLLETNCIFYCKIPDFNNFMDEIKDSIFLFSLIFDEVYIYKFVLGSQMNYLVCKNKKKINNESIYKKLLFCLGKYPIFTDELKQENIKWYERLDEIINDTDHEKIIQFETIKKEINDVLSYNYKTLQ